jgi:putative holliday junction resolvase
MQRTLKLAVKARRRGAYVENKSILPAMGRILGIDYGSVRIGLAVCDPDRRIASPLTTYQRRDEEGDAAYFKKVVEDEQITLIVVGLPVHLSGQEGEKAKEAREFGQWLGKATNLPIFFWDERFTTVEAEGHLLSAGLTRKRRRDRRDRVAAQILLQTYLDAGCPQEKDER